VRSVTAADSLSISRPRRAADIRPQGPSNDSPIAARAAATASEMSASVPRASSPKASPVLGSMTGIAPPLDGCHALLK
jgi:hypothetical protein